MACRAELVNITLSDSVKAVDALAQLLKFRTVSKSEAQESHVLDPSQFKLAHDHLRKSYPLVWKHLNVETVSTRCMHAQHIARSHASAYLVQMTFDSFRSPNTVCCFIGKAARQLWIQSCLSVTLMWFQQQRGQAVNGALHPLEAVSMTSKVLALCTLEI